MFRAKYICGDCENVFYIETESKPRGRCPSCPKCKEDSKRLMTQSGDIKTESPAITAGGTPYAPAKAFAIGGSTRSKAIDATAEIVMQDYSMSNIEMNTTLREGDNCVPKLAPHLESQVDKVFAPQKPIMGANQTSNFNAALTKQINTGMIRGYSGADDVVAKMQNTGPAFKTNIIHEYNERPN